jgi:hypothetical protein
MLRAPAQLRLEQVFDVQQMGKTLSLADDARGSSVSQLSSRLRIR